MKRSAPGREMMRTLVFFEIGWVALSVALTAAADYALGPLDAPTVWLIGFLTGGIAVSVAAKVILLRHGS